MCKYTDKEITIILAIQVSFAVMFSLEAEYLLRDWLAEIWSQKVVATLGYYMLAGAYAYWIVDWVYWQVADNSSGQRTRLWVIPVPDLYKRRYTQCATRLVCGICQILSFAILVAAKDWLFSWSYFQEAIITLTSWFLGFLIVFVAGYSLYWRHCFRYLSSLHTKDN